MRTKKSARQHIMYGAAVTDNVIDIQATSKLCPIETKSDAQTHFYEHFVDEHEVARFLQITPRRVLEMARKSEIPAHPLGLMRKTWRFRISEIDNHFSKHAAKRPSATIALAVPGTQERKRLG
jgi:hypothetical protein